MIYGDQMYILIDELREENDLCRELLCLMFCVVCMAYLQYPSHKPIVLCGNVFHIFWLSKSDFECSVLHIVVNLVFILDSLRIEYSV